MSSFKVYFICFFQIILGLFLEYKFSKYTIMILFTVLAFILTSLFSNIALNWMLPLSHPTLFFLPFFLFQLVQLRVYQFYFILFFTTDSQVRTDTMKSLPKPVGGPFCCVLLCVQLCPCLRGGKVTLFSGARLSLEPVSLFLSPFLLLTFECLVLYIRRSVLCNFLEYILYTQMVFTSALSHGCFKLVS